MKSSGNNFWWYLGTFIGAINPPKNLDRKTKHVNIKCFTVKSTFLEFPPRGQENLVVSSESQQVGPMAYIAERRSRESDSSSVSGSRDLQLMGRRQKKIPKKFDDFHVL